jgi:hypothetical protein
MTYNKLITFNYRYNKNKESLIKRRITTLFEDEKISNQNTDEEESLNMPQTNLDLFKLILQGSNYNLDHVKHKRTDLIEKFVYHNLELSVNNSKCDNSVTLTIMFEDGIVSINSQEQFDKLLDSTYNQKRDSKPKSSKPNLYFYMILISLFVIYIGLGLLSFIFDDQKSNIIKIGYFLILLIFELAILLKKARQDNFILFAIIDGTLLAVGIALILIFNYSSKLLVSLGILLIYPTIITIILMIIYAFAHRIINQILRVILDEYNKLKLIYCKKNKIKLYFPKSSKRIFYRFSSIVLKFTFISILVLFIFDLGRKALPKNIFTLLLLAIPSTFILSYLMRYLMYGLCQVCGTDLVPSSIEERIIPAYETTEKNTMIVRLKMTLEKLSVT